MVFQRLVERALLDADDKHAENRDHLQDEGDAGLEEGEDHHVDHEVEVEIALDNLEEDAEDDKDAGYGAETHGRRQPDLFPSLELQLRDYEQREQC